MKSNDKNAFAIYPFNYYKKYIMYWISTKHVE